MDPWVLTAPERVKHMEHFKSLNPVNGLVSGGQAKGFLMQSQLPPAVLAQIWGLADADKDGSLSFNEFSVACKLITMRLKGQELPKVLPPALLAAVASPTAAAPAALHKAPSLTSPVTAKAGFATQPTPLIMQQPALYPVLPQVPLTTSIPTSASVPISAGPSVMSPPIVPAGVPNSLPQTLSRKTSVSSQDSSPVVDWPVPQPTKLKYTQIFNQADKSKTGFMTGMQARQLLVQTGLNQTTLAKIWSLADIDGDGRLSCEEFILAMHLTDMVKRGEQLPVKLTPELVPPSFRRLQQQLRRLSGAAAGLTGIDIAAGTPPLIADGSGTPGSLAGDETGMKIPGLGTDIVSLDAFNDSVTFEDKRKENFDRGQAEIERRRKILQEQQQREIEERQRKEREEMERLERIRLEQEAKKQAELEKQLQRQREIEEAREEERRRIQEQRETARKEMERQRQLEWEKQRRQELLQQRQREQERVVHLKAQSQRLAAELEQMDGKIKELTDKVADTRSSVISVKGTIDGMRETRDEKIDELNKYKKLLMEHQQRMMVVVQEKAKLSERNRMNMTTAPDGNAMAATFAKKQAAINDLKAKLDEYKADEDQKLGELSTFTEELAQLKTLLTELLHNQKNLVVSYREKRVKVMDTRERVKSERLKALLDPTAAWGDDTTPIDVGPPVQDGWGEPAPAVEMPPPGTLYRALYDFERRNPDELSFYAGDVISITEAGSHEAGWFHGDLNGSSGWFPESYVELVTEAVVPDADIPIASAEPVLPEVDLPQEDAFIPVKDEPSAYEPPTNTFNGSAFTSEVNGSFVDGAPPAGCCVALYAYESAEPGDLNFQQGETIYLVKDEGDWWTGYLQDPNHTGVFPANYVQKVDQPVQKGKKLEVAKVIAPYQAASAEQLNLQRGQLLQIRKKSSSGWWEGELQAKGQKKQVGWFPGTYVKILVGSRSGSAASSTRTSPLPKEMFDAPPREQFIALYSYVAQNADELSFEKGEKISIISRDEKDWWKGELKSGETGLFPANYVELLRGPDSGNCSEVELEEIPSEGNTRQSLLKGLKALASLDACEKRRQECIAELINTEEAYVADMAIVKEVFEKPLRQNAVLTEYECHEIFVNWDELHHCNDKLLRALRVRKTRSNHGIISTVGDIMCENFPNMTQYIRYCACQLRACEILHRKKEENSEFEAVHRICVTDARSKGMPLSSFLLKPTQRITRYPLLLKNILKNTPIGHPDRLYLEEALEKAEELCSQVNEGVRERENSDTLEWIQLHVNCDALPEKITFNSITNLLGQRKFLHYGSLSKSKSGKELMGFLFNDFFLLATPTKPNTCKNLNIKRQPHVYLQLYRDPLILNEILIEKAGPEFSEDSSHFILKTLNTVVGLKASTPGDKQAWVKRIRAAAASYASTEKSLLQRQASAEDPPKGRVLVGVIGAFDLAQGKSGKCDPFCEVTMGSQVHRTKVVNGAVNPKWNHSMQFVVKDLKQDVLCLTIYDKDLFSPDEFLGRTEMRVSEIMEETGCTRGPVLKRLPLYEVQHGTVEVKFDLQLFQGDGNQRSGHRINRHSMPMRLI